MDYDQDGCQSYWLRRADLFAGSSQVPDPLGIHGGQNKSRAELQGATNSNFATVSGGIYSTWGEAWCDPATAAFAKIYLAVRCSEPPPRANLKN